MLEVSLEGWRLSSASGLFVSVYVSLPLVFSLSVCRMRLLALIPETSEKTQLTSSARNERGMRTHGGRKGGAIDRMFLHGCVRVWFGLGIMRRKEKEQERREEINAGKKAGRKANGRECGCTPGHRGEALICVTYRQAGR